MEIDKIIEELNEQGYASHKENNLIVVRSSSEQLNMQSLREKLNQFGYHNSFELILTGEAAKKYRNDFEKKSIFGKRENVISLDVVKEESNIEDSEDMNESLEAEMDFGFSENQSGQLSFF